MILGRVSIPKFSNQLARVPITIRFLSMAPSSMISRFSYKNGSVYIKAKVVTKGELAHYSQSTWVLVDNQKRSVHNKSSPTPMVVN